MNYTKMGTISTTYERCQAENIGISKNLIRELALSGKIVTVMAGRTRLINFDALMEYLQTGIEHHISNPKSGVGKQID